MSQQDNHFAGGFFLGAVLGSMLGGLLGATLASRYRHQNDLLEGEGSVPDLPRDDREANANHRLRQNQLRQNRRRAVQDQASEDRIEGARRSLEGKIAQLNDAIDDVRQQLEQTHTNEGSPTKEPMGNGKS
jgi:esterase/lipase